MFRTIFALALSGALGFTGLSLSAPAPAVAQVAANIHVGVVSDVVKAGGHRAHRGRHWRDHRPRYGHRWHAPGPRYGHRHHRAHRQYRAPRHYRPSRPIVRYHRPHFHLYAPVVPHVRRGYAPRVLPFSAAHYDWCYARYRSYRATDNTFQPYRGPRRQCRSPYA